MYHFAVFTKRRNNGAIDFPMLRRRVMSKKLRPKDSPDAERAIFEATEYCFNLYGIQKTTLSDIANRAGTSRVTLYRMFKDRQALIDAVILRNIERYWNEIGDELSELDNLGDWLVEGILLYQKKFAMDDLVRLYRQINGFAEGFRVATTRAGYNCVSRHFQHLYQRAYDEHKINEMLSIEDIADWVHRTNLSLVQFPSGRLKKPGKLRAWLSAQIKTGLVAS